LSVISLVISHPLLAQKEYSFTDNVAFEAETADLCSLATARMESRYGIREHLLQTISNVETGRWDAERQAYVSWPWTINVNGKGTHFATKEEAVAEVKRLQESGVTGIDVGCMQISLKYHQKAFRSLEEAFDPETNAAYSANFLLKLYKQRGSWQTAAMAYHSKQPSRGHVYRRKLLSRFEEIKVALLDKNEETTLF
jgi:hypothetical protein